MISSIWLAVGSGVLPANAAPASRAKVEMRRINPLQLDGLYKPQVSQTSTTSLPGFDRILSTQRSPCYAFGKWVIQSRYGSRKISRNGLIKLLGRRACLVATSSRWNWREHGKCPNGRSCAWQEQSAGRIASLLSKGSQE